MTITAAADGSALGNPGPAGWAWYVDDEHWAAGGWKHATNNQGELKAVLELFRSTAHLDDDLLVLCDSQYVINSVTKWMPGWKAKGWRKGDGKPVMNLDLLKEIDAELRGRRYRFEWVKGHANHSLNEAADSRARAVSEAYQRGAAIPAGPGWAGHTTSAGSDGDGSRSGSGSGGSEAGSEARTGAARVGAPTAVSTRTAAPRLFESSAQPSLFDDLGDEASASRHRSVVVRLDDREFETLTARASLVGVSVEEYLRRDL